MRETRGAREEDGGKRLPGSHCFSRFSLTTKHMSLVKRVKISLREFIVRRHQFQLKRRIKKAVKEPYEGKGLSPDEVYALVLKSIISQQLVSFTRDKKETKNHAA